MVELIKLNNLHNANFIGWNKYIYFPSRGQVYIGKLFPKLEPDEYYILDDYLSSDDITSQEHLTALEIAPNGPAISTVVGEYPDTMEETGYNVSALKEYAEITYFSAETLEDEVNYLVLDHSELISEIDFISAYWDEGYAFIVPV